MTIEAQLERIADALESLTGAMNAEAATPAAPVETPAPMPTTQAPAAPSFAQPAATEQPATTAPFANVAELTAFVMQEYQAMGAEKGAGIQSILQKHNYNNINDVQPQHFAAIKADIEALKAS